MEDHEKTLTLDEVLFGESIPQEQAKEEVAAAPRISINSGKFRETILGNSMIGRIKAMDEYSWRRGKMGGLDWGFERLNYAFEGLNPGVHLVAAQSNVGKSGFMMQIAKQVSYSNQVVTEDRPRKAFCVYFSLDDNTNELLPRFIAIDQMIPINVVRSPEKYKDNIEQMKKRAEGVEKLDALVDFFALYDSNDGTSIEEIEKVVEQYSFELSRIDETYQLVVFIDNFHDVTVSSTNFGADSNGRYDYIADRLSLIATKFDCPIICSAELRKLNGNRRPGLDDIRESTKIGYEAKAVLMCYNEVGLRGQQAQVFFKRPDSEDNQPVFEVDIRKNKYTSFKGRMFFEFFPEMSYFREVNALGAQRYNQLVSG
jgi:replicative DNA helicase